MENALPELSIVIPAHNEEKYLPATLKSLQEAIATVDLKIEIIVVDDASTDRTSEIAREFGCRIVSVEFRNIGAVRNAGAKVAVGQWLLFVDADTYVPAATLRSTIDNLRFGAIGGGAMVNAERIESFPWIKRLMYFAVVVIWQRIGRWAAGCYMFCRRDSFWEFGGFDERYFAAEEYFFSRNLKRRGRFVLVQDPVVTSTRKLAAYSSWQLLCFVFSPMLSGGRLLRSRKGLDVLYEGRR
jgi:glycosyltransferase involved in cell wall biosynthesis